MTQETKIKCCGEIYYYVPQSTKEKPIETLFQSLPKSEQYWKRQTDLPKFFYDYNPHLPDRKLCRINASKTIYSGDKLVTLSIEDTQELSRLVQREVRRMQNGIFIMNNGVKIYFPGAYYGMLQWVKMIGVKANNGYGEHRRYQREFASQRQKTIDTDELDGYYLHKIKKCGATQIINCFYVIESIISKQFIIASMSKNHDTCKSANFKYYTYGLKNLPPVLIPCIDQKNWGGAVQKIELRTVDGELSLENVVTAVPTTTDGLDGLPPIRRICLSEMPKMDEAEQILTKSREQARVQKTKNGIIEMESYPPEDDTKSFRYCKILHTKECMTLDENGYPKNKILALYIGLLESTNGTHDIYGEPDKFKALQLEQVERDKCDTPAKLQARKRQYHITAKEGWESGGGGSAFNNIILSEQEAKLEEEYNNFQLNYVQGNLEWTSGRMSPVRFVPLTLDEIMSGKVAKCKVYCTKEYMEANTNLCFKMTRKIMTIDKEKCSLLQPPDDVIHPAGIDPVDYVRISETVGNPSLQATTILDIEGNLLFTSYYRSEDPDEDIDDLCMAMIFWGLYAIVEGNRKNAITTLEKERLYYFILIRHPNGQILPYSQKVKIKHVSSSKDIKAKYIELITKKIKNKIYQLKSIEQITQLKEFDPADTEEYDKVVSMGLAEVALDSMQTWITSKKSVSDRYAYMGAAIAGVS